MKLQKEDVDKIVRTIEDSLPVYIDVKKALEDKKVSWVEAIQLLAAHGGKGVRLVMAAKEIGQELADLDEAEAELVMNELAEAYGQGNPQAFEGAKHIVKGLAEIRAGLEILIVKE
jgi:hypothetical protein